MSQVQFVFSLVGMFFLLSFARAYSEPLAELRLMVEETGRGELEQVSEQLESLVFNAR